MARAWLEYSLILGDLSAALASGQRERLVEIREIAKTSLNGCEAMGDLASLWPTSSGWRWHCSPTASLAQRGFLSLFQTWPLPCRAMRLNSAAISTTASGRTDPSATACQVNNERPRQRTAATATPQLESANMDAIQPVFVLGLIVGGATFYVLGFFDRR
jgi:hypothetical protein